jgi:hypothetical protein
MNGWMRPSAWIGAPLQPDDSAVLRAAGAFSQLGHWMVSHLAVLKPGAESED